MLAAAVLVALVLVPSVATAAPSLGAMIRPSWLSPTTKLIGIQRPIDREKRIKVSFVLRSGDPTGLTEELAALYDRHSPLYHHFLSSSEFLSHYGPAPQDVLRLRGWLRSRGLNSSVRGYAVSVSAAAGQLESALMVPMVQMRSYYAATEAPSLPSSIAASVSTVEGFTDAAAPVRDFLATPSPVHASGIPIPNNPPACATQPVESGEEFNAGGLENWYSIAPLLAAGENGHGVTIGILGLATFSMSDIDAFKSCYGLTNPFSVVNSDGGANQTGATDEVELDVEQASSIAPGASIILYSDPGTYATMYDSWNAAITSDVASVLTTSYGGCEREWQAAGQIAAMGPLFQEAAAQGQTVFAAAGDSGSQGCYQGVLYGNQNSTPELAVEYPASDPNVTGIGGTMLVPAPTYFPEFTEEVWNQCDLDIWQPNAQCAVELNASAAGGGGMSDYEPRPSWEPNVDSWTTAEPCGTVCREVPDISVGTGTGTLVYVNGSWGSMGGTSAGAPMMAAVVADIDSGCSSKAGVWAETLDAVYDQGSYGTAFDDITIGNNDMSDTTGTTYPATTGYDLASGIGTPIVTGLNCAEVNGDSTGYVGGTTTVNGFGLEHASFTINGVPATVVDATGTQAVLDVPPGSGTVPVVASSSILGTAAVQTGELTYVAPPPPPTATVSASVSGARSGRKGARLTETVRVSNSGAASGTATATLTVPAGVKVSSAAGGKVHGNRITWTVAVAPDSSRTVTVKLVVTARSVRLSLHPTVSA